MGHGIVKEVPWGFLHHGMNTQWPNGQGEHRDLGHHQDGAERHFLRGALVDLTKFLDESSMDGFFRGNLQESPIFLGKTDGFRFRFSLKNQSID